MKKRTKIWLTTTAALAIAGTAAATWLLRAPDHRIYTETNIGPHHVTLRFMYPSNWTAKVEKPDRDSSATEFGVKLSLRERSPLDAWLNEHVFHVSDDAGQKPLILVHVFTDQSDQDLKDDLALLYNLGPVTRSKCKVGTVISGELLCSSPPSFSRTSCVYAPLNRYSKTDVVMIDGSALNKDKAATFRAVDYIVSHLELIPEEPASAR